MTTSLAVPIVALDVGSASEALELARRVGSADGTWRPFFKVGSELFTAEGPSVVRALQRELGAEIFLDLKFNDIPNTVAGAVRSAAALGVRLITIHAAGGRAMIDAAQRAWAVERGATGDGGILAVTVLTSFDATGLATAWGRAGETLSVMREVVRLATDAAEGGVHGVVCSGEEASAVREVFGDRLALLVPGIRLPGGDAHDQRRVMTPGSARRAGARYLVLGRAVTAAADPAGAMRAVLASLGAPDATG